MQGALSFQSSALAREPQFAESSNSVPPFSQRQLNRDEGQEKEQGKN